MRICPLAEHCKAQFLVAVLSNLSSAVQTALRFACLLNQSNKKTSLINYFA